MNNNLLPSGVEYVPNGQFENVYTVQNSRIDPNSGDMVAQWDSPNYWGDLDKVTNGATITRYGLGSESVEIVSHICEYSGAITYTLYTLVNRIPVSVARRVAYTPPMTTFTVSEDQDDARCEIVSLLHEQGYIFDGVVNTVTRERAFWIAQGVTQLYTHCNSGAFAQIIVTA